MSGHCDDMSAEAALLSDQGCERRAILRALKSWTDAREDDEIPDLASLTRKANMAGGQEIFTENQFLIMFDIYSTDSVVIFYGSELPNALTRRDVGKSLQCTLPATLKELFLDACMAAVESGEAICRQGMISALSGAGVLYRSIFLPLRAASYADRIYVFGAFSNEDGGAELLAAA